MKRLLKIFCLILVTQISWAQTKTLAPELKQKVKKVAAELENLETHHMDPVAVNASLVWSNDKSQLAVVVKINMMEGWHIYAYVPETQPYIVSEMRLELPEGVTTIGDWQYPPSEPYEQGIYIYHGEQYFVQYCSVSKVAETSQIKSGLYYQTCDIHKCFPPKTKMLELKLKN